MLTAIFFLTLTRFCASDESFTSGSNVGTPHALKTPFCRRGHGQMNAVYIDEGTGKRKRGVLIFGGDGINYEQPSSGSSFLQDLWILSIEEKEHSAEHKEHAEHVEQGEYTHTWTRITEESTTTSISGNVEALTVSASWPERRWNFGYTVTEQGWLLIYGGENAENAANNVHFDDTWVFYENHWLQLRAFNSPQTGTGPGKRKGASLLLMPLSGLVMLWGGQRPPVGVGKGQNMMTKDVDSNFILDYNTIDNKDSKSRSHEDFPVPNSAGFEMRDNFLLSEKNKTDSEIKIWEESRRGRGRSRGPYVQCLSDTYIFNATAAVIEAVAANRKTESPPTDHLLLDTWRRVADFPGNCLYGAEAVGIVDPIDSKEKLFAFGGRYRAAFSSVKDIGNGNLGYLLADDIWLFDPSSDAWSKITRNGSNNWPEGRDKHAMVFVSELNTVFVSGGRLADPGSSQGDDGGAIDVVDMDLWGFDLLTRKWSQYGDSSVGDDDSVADEVAPAMSFEGSSMSSGASESTEKPEDNISDETTDDMGTFVISTEIGSLENEDIDNTEEPEEELNNQLSSENDNESNRGNSDKSSNGANNNNKWWVGVAGDLPAARYQHGLSIWRGVDGTEKPCLVCFGGERSDTPWDLQGNRRERSMRAQDDNNHRVAPLTSREEVVPMYVRRENLLKMREKEASWMIEGDNGATGRLWEWAVGVYESHGRRLRDLSVYETMEPSADQTAIDDDSFSGTAGGESDSGILGPVSSHAQSNDLWLLPLLGGETTNSPKSDFFFWRGEEAVEDEDEGGSEKTSDFNSNELIMSGRILANTDSSGRDLLSGGGDSGNRNRYGGGKGRGNPRRHRQPPKASNNSSKTHDNMSNSTSGNNGNSSVNTNHNSSSGNSDNDDNYRERTGWTLLSAGGCHYLDDGSQNDSSVDISALAIVGSFLLAVLFGLTCYRLLRHYLAPKVEFVPGDHSSYRTMFSMKPLDVVSILEYIPASIVPISVGARIRGYTDLSDESFPVPGSLETAGSIETKFGSEDESESQVELQKMGRI